MTAVEQLFKKLWNEPKDKLTWYALLKEAKAIEKQQAFEFWQGGIKCTEEGGKSFDQYYNDTYTKKSSKVCKKLDKCMFKKM
jgi:hypothetical protein